MVTTEPEMLAAVEAFLAETGMSATAFGRALKDSALVFQLRTGTRSLTLRKASEIADFMSVHRSAHRAAA